jgi:hypothetical protein
MTVLRELVARFGFEVDGKGAAKAANVVEGLVGKIEALGAGIAGAFAFHAVTGFIEAQIDAGSAVHDTAIKLGVSNQELQQFQYLGKLAGVGAEEMAGALGFMNKNAGLAASGNAEAAKTFASLGVSVRDASGQVRPASDLTLDFVDSLGKMHSQAERTAAITKVMGRAGAALLPAFEDGSDGVRKAFEEFQALGGGMSDDFVNAADDAGDQIDKLKFAFTALKSRIAGAVLPTLTKVTAWFTKAVAFTTRFTDNTNAAAVAITALGSFGGILAVTKLAKVFGLADGSVLGLVKSLLKFGPIVAVVALLALVFEDLYTLVNGGDSLIGRLLGGEASAALAADLRTSFDAMVVAVKDMLPDLMALGKILLTAFVDALPYMVKFFQYALKYVSAFVQLLTGAAGAVGAVFKGDWEGAGKAVDKAGNAVFGKGGVLGGAFDGFGGNTSSDIRDTAAWQRPAEIPATQLAAANAGLTLPASIAQTNQIHVMVQGGQTNAETGLVVSTAIVNAQRDKQNTLNAVRSVAPGAPPPLLAR